MSSFLIFLTQKETLPNKFSIEFQEIPTQLSPIWKIAL